jgi:hypothetical protein
MRGIRHRPTADDGAAQALKTLVPWVLNFTPTRCFTSAA